MAGCDLCGMSGRKQQPIRNAPARQERLDEGATREIADESRHRQWEHSLSRFAHCSSAAPLALSDETLSMSRHHDHAAAAFACTSLYKRNRGARVETTTKNSFRISSPVGCSSGLRKGLPETAEAADSNLERTCCVDRHCCNTKKSRGDTAATQTSENSAWKRRRRRTFGSVHLTPLLLQVVCVVIYCISCIPVMIVATSDTAMATGLAAGGIMDVEATVGQAFSLSIPQSWTDSELKVNEAGEAHLPHWLHYKNDSHTLVGVAGAHDTGQMYIRVTEERAGRTSHDDVFKIDVDHETHGKEVAMWRLDAGYDAIRQPWLFAELPKMTEINKVASEECSPHENVVTMSLTSPHQLDKLSGHERFAIISAAARHLNTSHSHLRLSTLRDQQQRHFVQLLAAGAGSSTASSSDGEDSGKLQLWWNLACGSYSPMISSASPVSKAIETVEQSALDGSLSAALGIPISSWELVHRRQRRQVLSGPFQSGGMASLYMMSSTPVPTPTVSLLLPTAVPTIITTLLGSDLAASSSDQASSFLTDSQTPDITSTDFDFIFSTDVTTALSSPTPSSSQPVPGVSSLVLTMSPSPITETPPVLQTSVEPTLVLTTAVLPSSPAIVTSSSQFLPISSSSSSVQLSSPVIISSSSSSSSSSVDTGSGSGSGDGSGDSQTTQPPPLSTSTMQPTPVIPSLSSAGPPALTSALLSTPMSMSSSDVMVSSSDVMVSTSTTSPIQETPVFTSSIQQPSASPTPGLPSPVSTPLQFSTPEPVLSSSSPVPLSSTSSAEPPATSVMGSGSGSGDVSDTSLLVMSSQAMSIVTSEAPMPTVMITPTSTTRASSTPVLLPSSSSSSSSSVLPVYSTTIGSGSGSGEVSDTPVLTSVLPPTSTVTSSSSIIVTSSISSSSSTLPLLSTVIGSGSGSGSGEVSDTPSPPILSSMSPLPTLTSSSLSTTAAIATSSMVVTTSAPPTFQPTTISPTTIATTQPTSPVTSPAETTVPPTEDFPLRLRGDIADTHLQAAGQYLQLPIAQDHFDDGINCTLDEICCPTCRLSLGLERLDAPLGASDAYINLIGSTGRAHSIVLYVQFESTMPAFNRSYALTATSDGRNKVYDNFTVYYAGPQGTNELANSMLRENSFSVKLNDSYTEFVDSAQKQIDFMSTFIARTGTSRVSFITINPGSVLLELYIGQIGCDRETVANIDAELRTYDDYLDVNVALNELACPVTPTPPAETTPAETTPAETTPAETTPITHAETTPVETTPVETTIAETTQATTRAVTRPPTDLPLGVRGDIVDTTLVSAGEYAQLEITSDHFQGGIADLRLGLEPLDGPTSDGFFINLADVPGQRSYIEIYIPFQSKITGAFNRSYALTASDGQSKVYDYFTVYYDGPVTSEMFANSTMRENNVSLTLNETYKDFVESPERQLNFTRTFLDRTSVSSVAIIEIRPGSVQLELYVEHIGCNRSTAIYIESALNEYREEYLDISVQVNDVACNLTTPSPPPPPPTTSAPVSSSALPASSTQLPQSTPASTAAATTTPAVPVTSVLPSTTLPQATPDIMTSSLAALPTDALFTSALFPSSATQLPTSYLSLIPSVSLADASSMMLETPTVSSVTSADVQGTRTTALAPPSSVITGTATTTIMAPSSISMVTVTVASSARTVSGTPTTTLALPTSVYTTSAVFESIPPTGVITTDVLLSTSVPTAIPTPVVPTSAFQTPTLPSTVVSSSLPLEEPSSSPPLEEPSSSPVLSSSESTSSPALTTFISDIFTSVSSDLSTLESSSDFMTTVLPPEMSTTSFSTTLFDLVPPTTIPSGESSATTVSAYSAMDTSSFLATSGVQSPAITSDTPSTSIERSTITTLSSPSTALVFTTDFPFSELPGTSISSVFSSEQMSISSDLLFTTDFSIETSALFPTAPPESTSVVELTTDIFLAPSSTLPAPSSSSISAPTLSLSTAITSSASTTSTVSVASSSTSIPYSSLVTPSPSSDVDVSMPQSTSALHAASTVSTTVQQTDVQQQSPTTSSAIASSIVDTSPAMASLPVTTAPGTPAEFPTSVSSIVLPSVMTTSLVPSFVISSTTDPSSVLSSSSSSTTPAISISSEIGLPQASSTTEAIAFTSVITDQTTTILDTVAVSSQLQTVSTATTAVTTSFLQLPDQTSAVSALPLETTTTTFIPPTPVLSSTFLESSITSDLPSASTLLPVTVSSGIPVITTAEEVFDSTPVSSTDIIEVPATSIAQPQTTQFTQLPDVTPTSSVFPTTGTPFTSTAAAVPSTPTAQQSTGVSPSPSAASTSVLQADTSSSMVATSTTLVDLTSPSLPTSSVSSSVQSSTPLLASSIVYTLLPTSSTPGVDGPGSSSGSSTIEDVTSLVTSIDITPSAMLTSILSTAAGTPVPTSSTAVLSAPIASTERVSSVLIATTPTALLVQPSSMAPSSVFTTVLIESSATGPSSTMSITSTSIASTSTLPQTSPSPTPVVTTTSPSDSQGPIPNDNLPVSLFVLMVGQYLEYELSPTHFLDAQTENDSCPTCTLDVRLLTFDLTEVPSNQGPVRLTTITHSDGSQRRLLQMYALPSHLSLTGDSFSFFLEATDSAGNSQQEFFEVLVVANDSPFLQNTIDVVIQENFAAFNSSWSRQIQFMQSLYQPLQIATARLAMTFPIRPGSVVARVTDLEPYSCSNVEQRRAVYNSRTVLHAIGINATVNVNCQEDEVDTGVSVNVEEVKTQTNKTNSLNIIVPISAVLGVLLAASLVAVVYYRHKRPERKHLVGRRHRRTFARRNPILLTDERDTLAKRGRRPTVLQRESQAPIGQRTTSIRLAEAMLEAGEMRTLMDDMSREAGECPDYNPPPAFHLVQQQKYKRQPPPAYQMPPVYSIT